MLKKFGSRDNTLDLIVAIGCSLFTIKHVESVLMKSCCGDKQTPESQASVEVFDPKALTGCCTPAATTGDTNAAQNQPKSGCCAAKTSDVVLRPTKAEDSGCCSPAADGSKSSCAAVTPASTLYTLAEPSKSAAPVDNDLFTDACCPPSGAGGASTFALYENC